MKPLALFVLGWLTLMLGGCGDSIDRVFRDKIDTVGKMADVLEAVKDPDAAKAAVPKLNALIDKSKEVRVRFDKLGGRSNDHSREAEHKYEKQFEQVSARYRAEYNRILGDPALFKHISPALQESYKWLNQ